MLDSSALGRFAFLGIMACLMCSVGYGASQEIADLGNCKLASGKVIQQCRIGYRTYGKLNADRSNIVLFPSWYNGQTRDMADLVGNDRLVNPDEYFVVTIDALGDGVSSSPSNGSGGQRGTRFPQFTIGDMVAIEQRLAVEILGVTHVHAVIGVSMGGMQAFEWAARFPHFMDVVISLMGTPRLTSADRLIWNIMRTSIQNDPAYQDGHYRHEPTLPLANEIDTLFAYTPAHIVSTTSLDQFPQFLKAVDGQTTIGATNRVRQIEAIERLDVLEGTSLNDVSKTPLPKMLVVVSRQDHTVNPAPSIEWAKAAGAQLVEIDDDCGHMAVSCALKTIAPSVARSLALN